MADGDSGWMKQRPFMTAAASALALVAIFLPAGWYDSIPRALPLPVSGVSLLRMTFALEAIVLAVVAAQGARFQRHPDLTASVIPEPRHFPWDISQTTAMLALALVTLLALALRLHNVSQDLWIDEITPITDYTHLSVAQVMGSYLRSNNHLLNTILLKASITAFGESELTVRLPAIVFGTLTIPSLYWVARLALSRIASVGSALVLATSYHHVFFSQNARGYTAYVLFALLSCGFLIRAMKHDRAGHWIGYVACVVLGSASLLITGFVIIGQAVLCAIVLLRIRAKGASVARFMSRIAVAMGIAGFLSFQVYAAALPEVYVTINSVYAEPATGFAPFSAEFFREMARGIGEGFGNPLFAVAFLVAGALGYAALFSLSWPLALALTLPGVLTAVSLTLRNLTFSPRFFLLWLPLAVLAAMGGVEIVVRYLAPRLRLSRTAGAASGLAALLLAGAMGKSLPYYYRTPKQPYRAALALADRRYKGDRIIIVSTAASGIEYYAHKLALSDLSRFVYTRDERQFDSLAASAGKNPQAITTFSRALRIELPGIARELDREWNADTTFAATVGDGEITVWSRKKPEIIK